MKERHKTFENHYKINFWSVFFMVIFLTSMVKSAKFHQIFSKFQARPGRVGWVQNFWTQWSVSQMKNKYYILNSINSYGIKRDISCLNEW